MKKVVRATITFNIPEDANLADAKNTLQSACESVSGFTIEELDITSDTTEDEEDQESTD